MNEWVWIFGWPCHKRHGGAKQGRPSSTTGVRFRAFPLGIPLFYSTFLFLFLFLFFFFFFFFFPPSGPVILFLLVDSGRAVLMLGTALVGRMGCLVIDMGKGEGDFQARRLGQSWTCNGLGLQRIPLTYMMPSKYKLSDGYYCPTCFCLPLAASRSSSCQSVILLRHATSTLPQTWTVFFFSSVLGGGGGVRVGHGAWEEREVCSVKHDVMALITALPLGLERDRKTA